jgi:hypothetical protein
LEGDQPIARPLSTQENTNRINAHIGIRAYSGIRTHDSALEGAKTVHALDCTATVRSLEVAGSIPDEVIGFLNLAIPSRRRMALGFTQPLTEMSTRNLPGGKARSANKAHNHSIICEPTVQTMWEGSSASHNTIGLHGLSRGQLYFTLLYFTLLYFTFCV